MPVVTTSDLYSAQSFRDLVLAPLLQTSVVLRALTRIDTTASVAYIPRVSGGNVGFVAEAAEIPDAGLGADLLEVIPRKLAGLAFTSRESAADAGSATILGEALARELAAATDRSFFAAGGGVAPVGLAGVVGVGAVDAAPGVGLDAYAQGIGALEGAGAVASVIFMNPADWTALVTVKESAGSQRAVLTNAATGPAGATQRALFGVPVGVTAGCPAGTAYVVDGTRVAAVLRQDGTVEASEHQRFTSDVVTIRATMRLAWAVAYPEAVCRITDTA